MLTFLSVVVSEKILIAAAICVKWETLKSGLPVIDGLIESLQKKK